MPIDIAVPGDPAAVRGVATWLRATFALAVSSYTDNLTAARTTAGADWDGDASWGFQSVMTTLATHGDDLDLDAQNAATGLDGYAAALETAQKDMAAVRTAATLAGLVVVADQIMDPGPGPVVVLRGPTLGGVPPARTAATLDRHAAELAAHDAKVAAYAQAETDTATIAKFRADAIAAIKTIPDATAIRWGLVSGTFVGAFQGVAYSTQVTVLKDRLAALALEVGRQEARYNATWTPAERIFQENLRAIKASELRAVAEGLEQSPHSRYGRLWGGRLPMIGTAVTIVGIGWDVHNGKDVSTALVGATFATVTAMGTAALLTLAAAPVVLVAVGSTVVAIAAGWTAEWLWENAVSDEVKAKVDDGAEWVADQVKSVGAGIADGASFVWGLVS